LLSGESQKSTVTQVSVGADTSSECWMLNVDCSLLIAHSYQPWTMNHEQLLLLIAECQKCLFCCRLFSCLFRASLSFTQ
jgi:hypothetical protein